MARIDAIAAALAEAEDGGRARAGGRPASRPAGATGAPAVRARYLIIYRTLADPAYLDLSIDPDDRPSAACSPSPTPSTRTTAAGGWPGTMTRPGLAVDLVGPRGHAQLAGHMPKVKVAHPAGASDDRDPAWWQAAREINDGTPGPRTRTLVGVEGRPGLYLEGHRPERPPWLPTGEGPFD